MESKNENARIEAFSDGVFAIAITLLVLDLKIPDRKSIHSPGDLWQALGTLWPSYFAFVLSFGFILISWVNHHSLFNFITHTTPAFIYANGFLLLTIVLLPFPTSLIAEYITTANAQPAVVFYCFTYVLQNLAWNLMYSCMGKHDLLKHEPAIQHMYKQFMVYLKLGLAVYVGTTIIAFWLPATALIINSLVWLVWMFVGLKSLARK